MDAYEYIDDYVNGRLEGDALSDFEQAMSEDEHLRQAVENHPAAMDVVNALLEEEVRGVLEQGADSVTNTNDGESSSEGKKASKMGLLRWAVAACALLLVGYFGFSDVWIDKLEAEIFASHLPDRPSDKKGGEQETTLDSIKHYFNTNRYDDAQEMIARYTANDVKEDAEINGIKMYIAFYQKDYKKAIALGESQDNSQLSNGQNEILFLSYILTRNKSAVENIFEKLPFEKQKELKYLFEKI